MLQGWRLHGNPVIDGTVVARNVIALDALISGTDFKGESWGASDNNLSSDSTAPARRLPRVFITVSCAPVPSC